MIALNTYIKKYRLIFGALFIAIFLFFSGIAVGHYKPYPFNKIYQLVRPNFGIITNNVASESARWRYAYRPNFGIIANNGASESARGRYAYRPNVSIINNNDSLLYSDLRSSQAGFKYKSVLLNDYDYYSGRTNSVKYNLDGCSSFLEGGILVAFLQKTHGKVSKEAVVLIHGNSLSPDDFFNLEDPYYSNGIGKWMFEQGFDIFAPYVTHNSRFQIARRRLAAIRGEQFSDLDVRRVRLLLSRIHKDYEKIHIVGASYGGYLCGRILYNITQGSIVAEKLGCVLSIEGWVPGVAYATDEKILFKWDYEMTFPGVRIDEFRKIFDLENFYVAYGSNDNRIYKEAYSNVSLDRVITYTGGHEFSRNAISQALQRYRNRE